MSLTLRVFACTVALISSMSVVQTDQITPSSRVVNSVNVREGPSADTPIVGELQKGQNAALLLSVPFWYHVRLPDGSEGFVSKAWTERIMAPAPAVAAAATDVGFTVHFLDVGTGDSAIIDIGDQEIVIDGGNAATVLVNYLRGRDIVQGPIELVVVTHGDADHWKGINRLMGFDGHNANPLSVLEFWEPGYDRDCNGDTPARTSYLTFIDRFRQLPGILFRRPLENFHPSAVQTSKVVPFTIPSISHATFAILHTAQAPTSANAECSYLINNASIVMKVDIAGVRLLFTGDANGKERAEQGAGTPGHVEEQLLQLEAAAPGTLKADVLKVPHHGSETASTQPFINAVDPQFAIISASTTHHLPRDTVVQRYMAAHRTILRTDDRSTFNNDHILCFKQPGQPLNCNYEAVLLEARRGSSPSGRTPTVPGGANARGDRAPRQ